MSKKSKRIAEQVKKGLEKLDREGALALDGKRVAAAILRLREERHLTWEQLHRRNTI